MTKSSVTSEPSTLPVTNRVLTSLVPSGSRYSRSSALRRRVTNQNTRPAATSPATTIPTIALVEIPPPLEEDEAIGVRLRYVGDVLLKITGPTLAG